LAEINPISLLPPSICLELSHIYGYRSSDSRNNIFQLNNEIVYPCAKVAIIMDLKENTQRFFRNHHQEVAVICVSKDG
jgi:hypothetical protein